MVNWHIIMGVLYFTHDESYSALLKLPMILKVQIAMVVGITTLVAVVAYLNRCDFKRLDMGLINIGAFAIQQV